MSIDFRTQLKTQAHLPTSWFPSIENQVAVVSAEARKKKKKKTNPVHHFHICLQTFETLYLKLRGEIN